MADRKPIPGQIVALTNPQMKNIITALKETSLDSVQVIRTGTFSALKRLNVERDTSKNWAANPKGSKQLDVRSILNWIESIQIGDDEAVDQLVIIDATACARGT